MSVTFDILQALCRKVHEVFPTAVIGGGAPRDVFLGGNVKDIDVFVQCDANEFVALCEKLEKHLDATPVYSAPYLHAPSYDMQVPGLLQTLNIIQRDCSPLMDVGDYDFGISQIAVDGLTVIRSAAQMTDVANNTITYMHADKARPDWHRKSSAQRLDRVLKKYPSLQPVHCELLAPWRYGALPF